MPHEPSGTGAGPEGEGAVRYPGTFQARRFTQGQIVAPWRGTLAQRSETGKRRAPASSKSALVTCAFRHFRTGRQ